MTELEAGDPAPDFHLPADDGGPITLGGLRGGKIVLFFYPRDDSETCAAEAAAFDRLRAQFLKAGTQIIGISPDSLASHARFKRKRQLALTLVSDERRAVIEAWGAWREKRLYGRVFMGVERTTALIDSRGVIARIWRKVRVKGHAEQVLAAARAL
jgi:thioredoxin-dependent peroxiredoxin